MQELVGHELLMYDIYDRDVSMIEMTCSGPIQVFTEVTGGMFVANCNCFKMKFKVKGIRKLIRI